LESAPKHPPPPPGGIIGSLKKRSPGVFWAKEPRAPDQCLRDGQRMAQRDSNRAWIDSPNQM